MVRYVLLDRNEHVEDNQVSLKNGVASIYNPKTDTTVQFTRETFEDHFERFEHFYNKEMYRFCYEIGLGVELSEGPEKED